MFGDALKRSLIALAALLALSIPLSATELSEAILAGDLERARRALDQGADLRAPDDKGAAPLVRALLENRTAIARLLLERGADISASSLVAPELVARVIPLENDHQLAVSPLMAAALMGNAEMTALLLDRGADIEGRAVGDATALHAAAAAGRAEVVKLLLARGASPDVEENEGHTPLELAKLAKAAAVVEVLTAAEEALLQSPVDVAGHYTLAAWRGSTAPSFWRWGALPVGIAVSRNGDVYWSEYRSGRIRRAPTEGTRIEDLALKLDGPLGVAFDTTRKLLFFTRDYHYPRSVEVLRPGQPPQAVISGTGVNRPFAIAAADRLGKVFWSESINGRIRVANADGTKQKTIFDDGISSISERAGVVGMTPLGLAVDTEHNWIFWSDLASATIVRAKLDGSEPQVIVQPSPQLELPTGLAVDSAAGKIYWADVLHQTISRANLDGSGIESMANASDGVLEPYGLAFDAERHLLYWTDLSHDAIYRIRLQEKKVERFLALSPLVEETKPSPPTAGCPAPSERQQLDAARRLVKQARTCLLKVAAIKAVKRRASDAGAAAATCASAFRSSSVEMVLPPLAIAACSEPQREAMRKAVREAAAQAIAADLPRAAEWLREVRPFVADRGDDASAPVAYLDDLLARIDRASLVAGSSSRQPAGSSVPATGQTTSYRALVEGPEKSQAATVPDDGALRAGRSLAFVDNGDGTITDETTGLMWEKKCDGCGELHDYQTRYPFTATDNGGDVQKWLAAINRDNGGFAGHRDWRLPTVSELQSIVDYELFNPAVTAQFDAAPCGLGCKSVVDPRCSCSSLGAYWTSIELPQDEEQTEAEVAVVAFHLGLIGGLPKNANAFVRAVRGAPRPSRFVDNGDGTISDQRSGLMWEKKCECPAGLHDFTRRYCWSGDGKRETVWDWLKAINRENGRGFAGYSDWRIPNAKELFTLVDYANEDLPVAAAFAVGDCKDVKSAQCSSIATGLTWTSTTFADFPAHALAVGFQIGNIDDRLKSKRLPVRAVRGPMH